MIDTYEYLTLSDRLVKWFKEGKITQTQFKEKQQALQKVYDIEVVYAS